MHDFDLFSIPNMTTFLRMAVLSREACSSADSLPEASLVDTEKCKKKSCK